MRVSPQEEWRIASGTRYEVSNHGRVRHARTKRIRKPQRNKHDGYTQFTGGPAAARRTYKVHQLVACAFLGPCPPGKEVNHKDTVKANNAEWNLEYLTRKENMEHAAANGRTPQGARHRCVKLTAEQVLEIRQRWQKGVRGFGAVHLAREYGVSAGTISSLLSYRSWQWL